MTGDTLVPVVAVFVGVLAANLALAWLLARRDWEPPDVLGASDEPGEDGTDSGIERTVADSGTERTDADSGTDTTASGVSPAGGPPPLDIDGETVVCRHCGAENRPEFRYCRWCVRSGFADDGSGAPAGPTMTERSM
ncbi:DUF7577 domain-containing protein [Halorubrum trueperi]|uniref:Zinc ribbon domain-containing protein n=1 Tax=Halorubrum trueperi TaxID=2004704 RepID=A0ABD5UEA7_9EURY